MYNDVKKCSFNRDCSNALYLHRGNLTYHYIYIYILFFVVVFFLSLFFFNADFRLKIHFEFSMGYSVMTSCFLTTFGTKLIISRIMIIH